MDQNGRVHECYRGVGERDSVVHLLLDSCKHVIAAGVMVDEGSKLVWRSLPLSVSLATLCLDLAV